EAVGEDDRPVPDGEWGRLVVTTFGRDNVLLRYDLEEAAKLDHADCGCGATSTRGWWGGRFKDLVTTAGRSFMLQDLERTLGGVAELTDGGLEYRVHRPPAAAGDAPLRLDVEVGDGHSGDREPVRAAVIAAFDTGLGLRVQVELLDRGTLPRAGFKTARVVDD
ncbi:MAG: phenylacetate--CoA ligase family protein, partial [Mycobacteriales bacterium]